MTPTQVITLANLSQGQFRFVPPAGLSGTPLAGGSFTFQVQDDGGTANGGIDTEAAANAHTITFNVKAAGIPNQAPSGADKTVTTLEDVAYVLQTADFGFSDTDGNNLHAVKVTTVPTTGTLTLNGTTVAAGQLVAASDINAGRLRYVAPANANGSPLSSFTFQVQDDGGTANSGVDLDQSPNTISVVVTPVNDAPTGGNSTVTATEDTDYVFGTADFRFSDPNDSPANSLFMVKITTLPAAGTLTNAGTPVTVGQFINANDIATGLLKFRAANNAAGANYASFTFQVQDNGGTTNGGVNLDPSAKTMQVNVTSVNDAPSGANETVNVVKSTTYTLQRGRLRLHRRQRHAEQCLREREGWHGSSRTDAEWSGGDQWLDHSGQRHQCGPASLHGPGHAARRRSDVHLPGAGRRRHGQRWR